MPHRFKPGDFIYHRRKHDNKLIIGEVVRAYKTTVRGRAYDGRSTEDGGQNWWDWLDGIQEDEWQLLKGGREMIWPMHVAQMLSEGERE